MHTLKQEAIEAISRLPETASVDEIMYELYVIETIMSYLKYRRPLEAFRAIAWAEMV
jgi:hypothetical protein